MDNVIVKDILIRTPYKFIRFYVAFVLLVGLCRRWVLDWSSGVVSALILFAYLGMVAYVLYLFGRFCTRKSLKQIVVHADGDITMVHFAVQDRSTGSHDSRTQKQAISISIKSNKMNLLERGKPVARIYRSTLKDDNDWGWLAGYFGS